MASAQVFTKAVARKVARKCLLLTNTGGNGHVQAAKSVSSSYEKEYPRGTLFLKDTFEDFLGKPIGRFFANCWNSSQKTGNLTLLEFWSNGLRISIWITWLPIFFGVLRLLIKEKIDLVIDTQPMGTSAILKAIRFYNFWYRKNLLLEKVLTDLPTEHTSLYFPFIRRLSKKDKKLLHIKTTEPLLSRGETPSSFWQKTCGISLAQVEYSPLPIRKSFLKFPCDSAKEKNPLPLTVKFSNKMELDLLYQTGSFGNLPLNKSALSLSFTIEPLDKVALVMMGAHPHQEPILQYIQSFIELSSKGSYENRRDILLIFCAKTNDAASLQNKIHQILLRTKNYPHTLTILPLPYQEDAIVAPLFYRSDLTLTRSGGITAMELLSTCSKTILIHKGSAPKWLPSFLKELPTVREGMPPWERGNAKYLEAKKGAKLVTPETFKEVTESYFAMDSLMEAVCFSDRA
jgi:hypothetical protein